MGMAATAMYSVKLIIENLLQSTEIRDWQKSGVRRRKVAPRGIENTGFFVDIGKGQSVYICSSENGGNSFYIAPLSDTLADIPKSARQSTHLDPIQQPIFRTFKSRSHRG